MAEFFGVSQGQYASMSLTAAACLKQAKGRIKRVQVLVAGSAAGACHDADNASGGTSANQVGIIPNAVGVYLIDMPCAVGIVVAPGTGQTVSASYE